MGPMDPYSLCDDPRFADLAALRFKSMADPKEPRPENPDGAKALRPVSDKAIHPAKDKAVKPTESKEQEK